MPRQLATTDDYVTALEAVAARGIAPSVCSMLNAHFVMPRRIATMRHLCAAAGFAGHSAGNRLYGGLARRIRDELELRYSGLSLWTIATWPAPPIDEAGEFAFRMRPEFAEALERLALVDASYVPPLPRPHGRRAIEGEVRTQLRARRKRERWLREAKIAEASSASPDGRLRCEVPGCGFDFEAAYGAVGRGYMQVHHVQPLASRARASETDPDDLRLVCANCHVMIHRDGESREVGGLL